MSTEDDSPEDMAEAGPIADEACRLARLSTLGDILRFDVMSFNNFVDCKRLETIGPRVQFEWDRTAIAMLERLRALMAMIPISGRESPEDSQ